MKEPVWVEKQTILLDHAEMLAEHGGAEGLRDGGLLESALARPKNLFVYGEVSDLSRLAACYAVGIIRNHPFVDGNKRTGFVAMALFLALNGLRLRADQRDAYLTMSGVASGEVSEDELAAWVSTNSVEVKGS